MRLSLAVALLASACGKAPSAPHTAPSNVTVTCEGQNFCLVATKGSGRIDFALRTFPASQLTLTLNFDMTNLQASETLPLTHSVKGEGEVPLVALTVADAGAAFTYKFDYQWGFGEVGAVHDDATRYRMPFETGTAHEVVQGPGGTFSHTGEQQNAVDFGMPEGTQVLAARGGVVLGVESAFDAGGTDPSLKDKANAVRIAHDDGTIGQYLHFQKDGVLVAAGQTVAAGDPIGLSGNTGYTSGPHLHFEVYHRIDGATRESLPIKFKAAEGGDLDMVEGQTYTAVDL
jgi:murein DD-endopeptidase MepM/ murein hydrolase activator NlpD